MSQRDDIDVDVDVTETREWLDALNAVQDHRGVERTKFPRQAARRGAADELESALSADHALPQHHSAEQEAKSPGDRPIEHRLRSINRWNALAIILRASQDSSELGGHLAASSRRRRSTTSASDTSGMRRRKSTAVTCCSFRATARRGLCPCLLVTKMVTAMPKDVLDSKILEQNPVGRLGKPEEVAGLVMYLALEEAAFLTGANRHQRRPAHAVRGPRRETSRQPQHHRPEE